MTQQAEQVVQHFGDATGEIDVWFRNPETGGEFGFGLPLPPSIQPQIAAGRLVRIAEPGAPATDSAAAAPEADEGGAADSDDDPALYPCQECGDVAVKDETGHFTDYCVKHTPKATGRGAKKA